ncbi:MAG: hypothetical protein GY865_18680 [candidate division Zixibacteria bacterium]|nr:hypothetical protein [candidate division Zixibacteria bacterium]
MYKKFIELFGKENLLDQALETTITMLESDLEMFRASKESLRDHDNAELPFDIYEKDKQINKYEREVRRNVLTHLTISGVHNIVPGLALVSIVIDVERIGDFSKNITELAKAHPTRLDAGTYENDLAEIEKLLFVRFDQIIKVLAGPNIDLAKQMMMEHRDISSQCDKMMGDIIRGKNTPPNPSDAVVLALYFRYLKRVASHLTNIASSIVNPFPRIGFRSKDMDIPE